MAGCKENDVDVNREAYEESGGSGESGGSTTLSYYDFESSSGTSGIGTPSDNDANWYRSTTSAYGGSYSYRSGSISHYQKSCFQITRTSGSGYFYFRTSSEASYDHLKFYIDGSQQSLSNSSGVNSYWTRKSFYTTTSSHTFKWCFEKDSSRDEGFDSTFVDNIRFY